MVTVMISGRMASDPEQKEVKGTRVTQFSVAARTSKKDTEGKFISNFYRCSIFGAGGDIIVKNFHQGDGIVVMGDLVIRSYVATNGETRYSFDVGIKDFEFGIGKKQSGGEDATPNESSPAPRAKRQEPVPVDDDDLPF